MWREWSKVSPDTLFGKMLRLPLVVLPKFLSLPVCSGINKGMLWRVGSSIHKCWLGTYEMDKQSAIERFVKPGMKVFDIGANAGYYTLAFSRLVGVEGHVYAFEPLAENVDNLLRHIKMNFLRNVTLLQTAVVDGNGMLGFELAENNSMGKVSNSNTGYLVPSK
ncbi:MAG: FkbM family methyltransferase [Methylococcaceae bacterium]|nr:FkbM family methyltransferase [Methylococcaceae bacterium]